MAAFFARFLLVLVCPLWGHRTQKQSRQGVVIILTCHTSSSYIVQLHETTQAKTAPAVQNCCTYRYKVNVGNSGRGYIHSQSLFSDSRSNRLQTCAVYWYIILAINTQKLSEQKYTLANLRFESPHLPKISHVSNSRHTPNGRLKKDFWVFLIHFC